MNTDTLAGRIEVEKAALAGKKIQIREKFCTDSDWRDTSGVETGEIMFNWSHCNYRVAPEPKVRPWKCSEVPLGQIIISKADTDIRLILTSTSKNGTFSGQFKLSLKILLEEYALEDGSPCGVVE